ncbi:MAG: ATP-binding protein, partial [Anaerolinea sp.]|nr:ATP-binding protein [Anaerolinea sp.]
VEVDYERMVQVFSNLIGNASKFAPEGGSITIAAQTVSSNTDLDDRFAPPDITLPALVVTVLDSGAGLSPDDAEQIFLPFYRTSSAKARKVEGYGLGLAIAQSLIEAHRGKIWAVPVPPASGGCFRLTIPIARG